MKFRIMLVLLALVMPTVANALGLGKLELQSALNQPFKARVELISATADELDSLKISLADQEAFDRAGIQRTFLLTRLRFAIQESEKGPDYIQIRSNESIHEPFLNFLLEMNWSKGRLYREYTVLLDPPTYTAPDSKKQAVIHPETPVVEIDSGDHQVVYDLEYKSRPEPTARVEAPDSYEEPRAISYSGSGDYGPAVTGDTLWSIAKATRPDSSVSIQQMMLAILSANPEAFIENNINGLKRGAILQIPDASEANSLDRAQALAQAKNQNALWDEYKGYIASRVAERPDGVGTAGQVIESVDVEREATVVDVEVTDKAELRLISEADQGSGSDRSAAESSGVDVDVLNNELVLVNESIEALTMENAELKDKLTETEGIIDDLKRLIVLKEDELAAMQEQIMVAAAEQESTDEIVTETDTEEAEEAIEEDETDVSDSEEIVVEDVDVAPADDEGALFGLMGLVEKAKDNLMIIAGAVGGLLLLVFLMLFASKRRSAKATVIELPAEDFPDSGDDDSEKKVLLTDELPAEDSESVTIIPGSDDDDATISPGDDTDAAGDTDLFEIPDIPEDSSSVEVEEPEDDPMEEVNVFLAYEHFDEAESFVREGLEREPNNLGFHIKLLEVFYAAGNKKSYEEAARDVLNKTGGKGEYWDMATVMWQEMSPNRALFDTPVEGEDEEASSDTTGGGVLNIAADDDGSDTGDMDFNIGEEASGEDILDVTAVTDIDSIPDVEGGSDDLDFSLDIPADEGDVQQVQQAEESGLEEEVLDVKMASNVEDEISESSNEESLEFPAAEESEDALDISIDEPSSEDDVLDISIAEESEDALDISIDEPSSEDDVLDISIAEESEDALDISIDEPSSEEDVLDISTAEESDDADELDISLRDATDDDAAALLDEPLDTKATESTGEDDDDLLDVTSAYNFESEGEEDLLDVTAAVSAEDIDAGDLMEPEAAQDESDEIDLDLSVGEESLDIGLEDDLSGSIENETDGLMDDELKDIDDTTGEDSGGLDFDLSIDDDSDKSAGLELDTSEEANDASLSMAEDDDDKTFLVPKTSDVDEQSDDEEMASQLDLAKAYIELGDNENAKTILDEIIAQGSEDYRKQAEELIGQIK